MEMLVIPWTAWASARGQKTAAKKMVSYSSVDFLPICDLLFNFISVASYFCDIAFHIIVAYTFYRDGGLNYWFLVIGIDHLISFRHTVLRSYDEISTFNKSFIKFDCAVLWLVERFVQLKEYKTST